MAYTIAWNEASPLGSDPANTLHTIIQNKQIASRERLAGIFGLTALEWAADPIVPKSLALALRLQTDEVRAIGVGNFIISNNAGTVLLSIALGSGNITASLGAFVGNITGNLTGTVITPAQANITSLGTLTGLVMGGNISFGSATRYISFNATDLIFGTAATDRWKINANGHLFASLDNTYDIGSNGASRPRDIWVAGTGTFGTGVTAGGFSTNNLPILNGWLLTQNTKGLSIQSNVGANKTAIYLDAANVWQFSDGFPSNFNASITATAFIGNVTGNLSGNVTGNLTGTILTSAQANITSLGTLTGLTVNGNINISGANSLVIAGAGVININGNNVLGPRQPGWATQTTAQSRADMGAAPTLVTTYQTLAALVMDARAHGWI